MNKVDEFFWSKKLKAYVRVKGVDGGPPYHVTDYANRQILDGVMSLNAVKDFAVSLGRTFIRLRGYKVGRCQATAATLWNDESESSDD